MRQLIKKIKNNSNEPYIIGITGGFGTGKSLVGNILKKQGMYVIDTDHIVKQILSKKNHITKTLLKTFGNKILSKAKSQYINKKVLANIVFKNSNKRKILEKIIHPEVRKKIKYLISHECKFPLIAVLVPLLFESNMASDYDEIWTVSCSKKKQIERLIKKDFTKQDIKARIKAQLPLSEKIKKSDYVINNSGSVTNTKNKVLKRIKELVQLNHNHRLSSYRQY